MPPMRSNDQHARVEMDWRDGDAPSTQDKLTASGHDKQSAEIPMHLQTRSKAELEAYCQQIEAENRRLRATLSRNVAEYADEQMLLENGRLKQQMLVLQHKLQRTKLTIVSAKVVDTRLSTSDNRQFVEYKIEIETNKRGTLFAWHRYSTFRTLSSALQSMKDCKRDEIPVLPRQLFGRFSPRCTQERVTMLNAFLDAACKADHLHWGIRVDEDTCIYKRRVKKLSSGSMSMSLGS